MEKPIETTKKPRGFAAMTPERRREVASAAGKAAHAMGRAPEFTPEEARVAGAKGGAAVSKDREHMRKIGRKGGVAASSDRERMVEIGRAGGKAVRNRKAEQARDGAPAKS